jgi:hypothetical protein
VRSVQRPDGKIVSAYYYNTDPHEERTIEVTVWDPDYQPPYIYDGSPQNRFYMQGDKVEITVHTDQPAQCRYAFKKGRSFEQMKPFSKSGQKQHKTTLKLEKDIATKIYIKAQNKEKQISLHDYVLRLHPRSSKRQIHRVMWEAEKGKGVKQYRVVKRATCSGNTFLWIRKKKKEIYYEFEILSKSEDDYVLWQRVKNPGWGTTSFDFRLSAGGQEGSNIYYTNRVPNSAEWSRKWAWVPVVTSRKKPLDPNYRLRFNPRIFTLSPGKWSMRLTPRGKKLKIDAFFLTNDLSYTPQDSDLLQK